MNPKKSTSSHNNSKLSTLLYRSWKGLLTLVVHLSMLLANVLIAISLALSILPSVTAKGEDSTPNYGLQQHITTMGYSPSSPWLKKVTNPRAPGCWKRPWICDQGERLPRMRCCRNRCLDVSSDVNNCGLCGIRCPFTWQCCRGLCIDTNISPFNCGRCGHRCPFRSLCYYGMCGYAEPWPRPPFPPKPPNPPKPPKPPKPPHCPPRVDQPPTVE